MSSSKKSDETTVYAAERPRFKEENGGFVDVLGKGVREILSVLITMHVGVTYAQELWML